MKNTLPDIVTVQLKAIGCDPIPTAVRSKIEADFEEAVFQLAEQRITTESFARAVREVYAPRKKGNGVLPAMPSTNGHESNA